MLLPSIVLQPSLSTSFPPPLLPYLLPSSSCYLNLLLLHIIGAAAVGEAAGSWRCVPGFEPRACSFPSGGYYTFSFIIHTICRGAHACTAATLTVARAVSRACPAARMLWPSFSALTHR